MDQGVKQDFGRDGSPVQQVQGPRPHQDVQQQENEEEPQQLYELDTLLSPTEYNVPLTQRHFQPSHPSPQSPAAVEHATAEEEPVGHASAQGAASQFVVSEGQNYDDLNSLIYAREFYVHVIPTPSINDPYITTRNALNTVESESPSHSPIDTDVIRAALGSPMKIPYVTPPPQKAPDLSYLMVNIQSATAESCPTSPTSASNPKEPTSVPSPTSAAPQVVHDDPTTSAYPSLLLDLTLPDDDRTKPTSTIPPHLKVRPTFPPIEPMCELAYVQIQRDQEYRLKLWDQEHAEARTRDRQALQVWYEDAPLPQLPPVPDPPAPGQQNIDPLDLFAIQEAQFLLPTELKNPSPSQIQRNRDLAKEIFDKSTDEELKNR
jgi:hypothetical protein